MLSILSVCLCNALIINKAGKTHLTRTRVSVFHLLKHAYSRSKTHCFANQINVFYDM